MSSPVEEMLTPASTFESPAPLEAGAPPYGPDEENLVQLAHREAMLRLARAM